MAVYNWRNGSCKRPAAVFDAGTHSVIPYVFFVDDVMGYIGRFGHAVELRDGLVYTHIAIDEKGMPVEIYESRPVRIEWKDEADAHAIVDAHVVQG